LAAAGNGKKDMKTMKKLKAVNSAARFAAQKKSPALMQAGINSAAAAAGGAGEGPEEFLLKEFFFF
jgi:hypothetical protein